MTDPYQVLQKLTSFYQEVFWSTHGAEARGYLEERGFLPDTLSRWAIGYCPPKYSLSSILSPAETEVMNSLKQVSSRGTDRLEGRITFPIFSEQGVVTGFSGRLLHVARAENKYWNSPSSDVFRKADSVYGLNFAREAIVKADNIILTEGFTDAMALHQANIPIAISVMGTHFTREQLLRLGRYSMNLRLAFDGDGPGDVAFTRSYNMAVEMGFRVGRITLPDGVDPADLIRKPVTSSD